MVFQKGNKWAVKPGEVRNPKGKKKGTIDKKKQVEWSLALIEECLELDPKTGKKLSPYMLKKRFSSMLWNNPKMVIDYFDRKLGKPVTNVNVQEQSVIHIHGPSDKDVVEGEIIGSTFALKEAIKKDNDDDDIA